jgi:transposase
MARRCRADRLESFARTLRKDYETVRAAFSYEWSNGQVEGQLHRLKPAERSMYGRVNFDFLKQRALAAAQVMPAGADTP